jgi:hypothetical protein
VVAGQPLTDRGQGVVAELDQVERVDADGRSRQVGAQRLAERRGWIDRDNFHLVEPPGRPCREPGPDAGAVAAVDHTQHLPRGDVDDG